MSPIRIIIRGLTRLVLIWDGEVTADITTHATTSIGDTTATIPAKVIITATSGVTAMTVTANTRGTCGAASRDIIGADEMNVSPGAITA